MALRSTELVSAKPLLKDSDILWSPKARQSSSRRSITAAGRLETHSCCFRRMRSHRAGALNRQRANGRTNSLHQGKRVRQMSLPSMESNKLPTIVPAMLSVC